MDDAPTPVPRLKRIGKLRPGLSSGIFSDDHKESNMVPVQKIINHYKNAYDLEQFRKWLLGELHLRIARLPREPRSEKSIRHKAYLLKVANYFSITPERPFSKVFYFESVQSLTPTTHEHVSQQEAW